MPARVAAKDSPVLDLCWAHAMPSTIPDTRSVSMATCWIGIRLKTTPCCHMIDVRRETRWGSLLPVVVCIFFTCEFFQMVGFYFPPKGMVSPKVISSLYGVPVTPQPCPPFHANRPPNQHPACYSTYLVVSLGLLLPPVLESSMLFDAPLGCSNCTLRLCSSIGPCSVSPSSSPSLVYPWLVNVLYPPHVPPPFKNPGSASVTVCCPWRPWGISPLENHTEGSSLLSYPGPQHWYTSCCGEEQQPSPNHRPSPSVARGGRSWRWLGWGASQGLFPRFRQLPSLATSFPSILFLSGCLS